MNLWLFAEFIAVRESIICYTSASTAIALQPSRRHSRLAAAELNHLWKTIKFNLKIFEI